MHQRKYWIFKVKQTQVGSGDFFSNFLLRPGTLWPGTLQPAAQWLGTPVLMCL